MIINKYKQIQDNSCRDLYLSQLRIVQNCIEEMRLHREPQRKKLEDHGEKTLIDSVALFLQLCGTLCNLIDK